MAISERSDIWKHVQRRAWEDAGAEAGNVRRLPFGTVTPTVTICADEPSWFSDRYRERGEAAIAGMEKALAAGRQKKADAHRMAYAYNVHLDRLAKARSAARDNGLRLDPMGRGPLPDLPVLHYRDRLPWGLIPVARYDHDDLPDRASSVIDAWNGLGEVFDRYIVAHEPPGVAPFPTHCLIGAVSCDGRTADWFVLDRWAT